ncbi:MAG: tetratricopeptide repeat protein, partial [Anaerolineales bacterium]
MAEITLRAYVKEIDDLIEREKLDEAIAHCRHILQIYPKHLETYRMLGKAYLEAKRFGDAADIFQRVLSAVPDDFVSHVGMALVREDEGNLDAAIWHMERAFETNPANPAIRQELSRLIGRRDGLEPHKVRLTRGALARQYAQGELFPQAISELRSALQEDPDRPDLEVLLAKMYWRAGQTKEAKKICDQILEKLPFSLEANRIMADLAADKGDEQKAGEYHRKLAALDPYFGFLESVEMDPTSIDAGAVRIEQSSWSPGEPLPTAEETAPAWVTSLGVDLSEGESDAINTSPQPAWLSDLDASKSERSHAASVNEPAFDDGINSELESEDAIPEWMREAGWGPASGEAAEEGRLSFSDAELDSLESGLGPVDSTAPEEGDLEPAEIPSWMQSIAPKDGPPPEETPRPTPPPEDSMDEGMIPDWLSEVAAEDGTPEGEPEPTAEMPEPEVAAEPEEVEPEPAEEEGPGVPTWVDTQSPGATSTIIAWLGDREGEKIDEERAVDELAAAFGAGGEGQLEDFPSWLEDTEDLAAEEVEEPEVETTGEPEGPPSWLAGVAEAASRQDLTPEPEAEEEPAAEEPPSYRGVDTGSDTEAWIRTLAEQEEGAPEAAPAPGGSDWLTGFAEEESAGEPAEAAPDWLAEGTSEEDEIIASRLSAAAETPDWLEGVEEVEPETPAAQGDVPDWLVGIAEGTAARPPAEPSGFEAAEEPEGGAPDWLRDFSSEGQEISSEAEFDAEALQEFEAEISLEPQMDQPEPAIEQTGGLTEDLDDEEVFKWLESLAEGQETAKESTTPEPSIEPEAKPEEPVQPEPTLRAAAPPDEPDESLRWLEDLAAERGIDIDIEAASFQAGIEQAAAQAPPVQPAEVTPTESAVEPAVKPIADQEAEPSPDWLIEMATQDTEETVIARQPPSSAEPALTAFSEEPETGAPEAQEIEESEIPGWLDEAAAVAQEVPAEPEPSPRAPVQEKPVEQVPPAPAAAEPEPVQAAPEKRETAIPEQPAPAPFQPPAAETVKTEPEPGEEAAPPVSDREPVPTPAARIPEPPAKKEEEEAPQRRYKEPLTDAQQ